jgi:hypothetical protein
VQQGGIIVETEFDITRKKMIVRLAGRVPDYHTQGATLRTAENGDFTQTSPEFRNC